MNQRVANRLNAIVVSAYKFMGSVLLALILLGLISFLTVQGFFMVRKEMSPRRISASNTEPMNL